MKSKWVTTQDFDDSQDPYAISTYLTDPVIKSSAIKEAGGVMKYWDRATQHRPRVSWDLTFALHQVTFTVFILIFTKPVL
jgi:hypothetical protein